MKSLDLFEMCERRACRILGLLSTYKYDIDLATSAAQAIGKPRLDYYEPERLPGCQGTSASRDSFGCPHPQGVCAPSCSKNAKERAFLGGSSPSYRPVPTARAVASSSPPLCRQLVA